MNNDTHKQNTPIPEPSTTKRLFERIEAESITPTPRLAFVLTQWGIWSVWVATVLFGAVALAVSGYVTLSAQYALYEATHENFLTFFVAVMPYIWVALFALMTYVSVYEIRKTKNGYRYNTFLILGSNLAFTVLGAAFLHSVGMGYALDKKLGEQISMYMSMEKMEQNMWQMPEEGRLIGILEPGTGGLLGGKEGQILNFKDITGSLWRLNVEDLDERELGLLGLELPVRVIGTTTSEFSFHVCGVFPGIQSRAMPRKEMMERRREFDAVMHDKMRKIEDWAEEAGDGRPEYPSEDSPCARLPVMKRLR